MKNKISTINYLFITVLFCGAIIVQAWGETDDFDSTWKNGGEETQKRFDFANAPQVNVANTEELYAAVNNPANAGNQIVMVAGVYTLSATDSTGAARPNGGRLELQENMLLRGVTGNRDAVVIDAVNLPTASYAGTAPVTNTGAIRLGKGTNAVEWLTIKNAVNGGAGIIVHLSAAGAAYVRIAHCASTGHNRGIDIRNIGTGNYAIEAEIVDNDLYGNRINTGQGLRIVTGNGTSGAVVNAYLSGNRMFDNQQGLLVENIGGSAGSVISVYSSGDRFYENGGGAFIGGSFGASMNGNTTNFTAVGSTFENNNGFTNFYRGGLNVIGGVNTTNPNGVTNNAANAVLRNCRFANNQNADLAVYGASSFPTSAGVPGTNNRAKVRLYGTLIPNIATIESEPTMTAGTNSATVIRHSVTPNSDFDGDGRADLSVFRPSDRTWYLNRSTQGFSATQFGLSTDKITPADFDGDGKTDIAVFRNGIWYWLNSSNNQFRTVQFGLAGDFPQPADYDGDGRAEIVVWRLNPNLTPVWYVYNLSSNQVTVTPSGISAADLNPVIGDFNGDGRADYAMFDANETLTWHIRYSGTSNGFTTTWGLATDKAVPADYDGDGKTDLAVYRNGLWYVLNSSSGNAQIINWGLATDALVPADYDGDGRTDAAVFRDGVWYLRQITNGLSIQQFGLVNDKPAPSAYLP